MQDPSAAAPEAPGPDQSQGQEFTSDDATGATQGDASFQTFYDSLSDQGTWIQSNDYGYVWQPQVNDPDWAPYTQGHWAYTDDGWTWVSDEQFGWATYHYGRWTNIEGYGWVWVPGYTWAPAWVSWRYGDGYTGWAPLPPDSFVGVDYANDDSSADFGYHIGGDCDNYYGIGVGYYIFLPVNCLGYHNYHGYYCNRQDNWHLIGHTHNVTNINVGGRHQPGPGRVAENGGAPGRSHRVTVGGPQLADVNAVSKTPIQKVNLTHTTQRGGGTLTGNSLALYAPRMHTTPTGATLQPAHVTGTIGQARINHGTDITKPLAVNARLAPAAATQEQIQQAHLAQGQIPSTAKVVTDDASVKPVLQRPLTTMKPVTSARSVTTPPGNRPGATSSSATYQTPQMPPPPTPTYAPAHAPTYAPTRAPNTSTVPSPTYAPSRVYPQAGGNESTPTHTYTPGTVYPSNPQHTIAPQDSTPAHTYTPAPVYSTPPASHVAPTRTYEPATPSYTPRSAPIESGGGNAPETHTYVRPSAPATSAPASESHSSPAPAPSSGGGNSSGNSGGGHGSSSSSSSSSSSGASSTGTSTGNGRTH